jgi:signal transduction histidine kinase
LQGKTTGEDSDRYEREPQLAATDGTLRVLCRIHRLEVAYLLGDYERAEQLVAASRQEIRYLTGSLRLVEHAFYAALTGAMRFAQATTPERRAEVFDEIEADREKLEAWAAGAPWNFRHKLLLVQAEIARLLGSPDAGALYDESIDSARAEKFLQDEAIANELAGRHYRALGRKRIGDFYLSAAARGFASWGALAKVQALADAFPGVVPIDLWRNEDVASSSDSGATLDLMSILATSEAISSEIALDRLIETLMESCVAAAGAEKAVLLLEEEGGLFARAAATVGASTLLEKVPLAECAGVARSAIEHARKAQSEIVLADAATRGDFVRDPHIAGERVRSVLVLPIRRQAKLVGILYFENNLATRAFTPDRVRILQLLSAQIAISLDNSLLFEKLSAEMRERKQAEEHLRQVQKIESVGLLAGGIAHDFNNMLTPILGYSELLLQKLEGWPATARMAHEIQEAGERASALTRKLLAFGRKQLLELKATDLGDVVTQFEPMLRRTMPEDIRLDVVVARSLGAVLADVGQIEQVLMNLVINARDAMPQGGRVTIEVQNAEIGADAAERPDGESGRYVKLAVRDTGIGMDKDTQLRVFEPFFTTKEQGKGTGLGLATVHGIVKQHGGTITLDSEPGKGSIFTLYLPVAEGAAVQARSGNSPSAGEVIRLGETILVVDDNDAARSTVCEMLRSLGYLTLSADSVEGACIVADGHDGLIGLLLTDVMLPKSDGRELFRTLSGRRSELKVLYMSGYAGNVIVQRGIFDDGGGHFLAKPFSLANLAAKVREVLDG